MNAFAQAMKGSHLEPEISRRTKIFQKQLKTRDTLPLLHLPGAEEAGSEECLSCRVPLAENNNFFRCVPCQLAAWIALEIQPEEVGIVRKGLTLREAAAKANMAVGKARKEILVMLRQGKIRRTGRGVKSDPFRYLPVEGVTA